MHGGSMRSLAARAHPHAYALPPLYQRTVISYLIGPRILVASMPEKTARCGPADPPKQANPLTQLPSHLTTWSPQSISTSSATKPGSRCNATNTRPTECALLLALWNP